MKQWISNLLWYIFGFIMGAMVMTAAFTDYKIKEVEICKKELLTCNESLNDPHSCVSVVVEFMEGHHE